MNEDPMPEEEGGDDLGPIEDELNELSKSVQDLGSLCLQCALDIEEIFQKLNEIWPGIPVDAGAAGSGNFFWVTTDGGLTGNVLTQCSLTYTVEGINADATAGDGNIQGTSIPLTGPGQRGARGKMNAGNLAFGYINSGTPVLIWINETSAAAKKIPITIVRQSGGADGDDTTYASWGYDFADMEGNSLGLASPVLKHRLSFGSVTPAEDGSTADGIDYGDGTFAIWDVSEIYATTTCVEEGG